MIYEVPELRCVGGTDRESFKARTHPLAAIRPRVAKFDSFWRSSRDTVNSHSCLPGCYAGILQLILLVCEFGLESTPNALTEAYGGLLQSNVGLQRP